MSLSSYQELDLPAGASINEIKAAYRRLAKAHHPDAEGRTQDDVEKFIKGQTAYQRLMKKAVVHNRLSRDARSAGENAAGETAKAAGDGRRQARGSVNWRFESSWEAGLDVHYRLSVLRPGPEGGSLTLPWQAREACPRCLGHGHTLCKVGQNSLYRPCVCSKCGGLGSVIRESNLVVRLNQDLVGRDKIRLRRCGLYDAKSARRGDLILEVNWVDHLPPNGGH